MANSANPEINKKIATSALGTLVIATVFFYLGDRYAETLVTYPGQIFDHLSDAFLSMWQTIKDAPFALDMTSNSLLFGGACFLIIWMIWLRYVAFIGNYRSGEESGSARWGTVKEKEYITLISFTGKHGSVIYLNNYLSVMFNISDVMIDKEEIAMKMQLPIHVPEEITIEDSASVSVSETVTDSQITVTKNDSCVPDSHMKFIVQKVAELLDSQGIPCCHCSKTRYILSPLSACKDIFNTFTLNIICPYGNAAYRFELSVSPGDESAQKMPAVAEPSALKGGE